MGRFINADGFISTGQGMLNYNIFAYCNNDPVNYKDPNGATPIDLFASLFIGAINNFINAIYYEFSDGKSNLASDSYTDENKIVTRWEKLDYTKQETGEDHYNVNAWRYYNEYSVHEYGWYAVGWADEKNIWGFSWLAERFKTADVYPNCWDGRWYVDIATVFVGLLGI